MPIFIKELSLFSSVLFSSALFSFPVGCSEEGGIFMVISISVFFTAKRINIKRMAAVDGKSVCWCTVVLGC